MQTTLRAEVHTPLRQPGANPSLLSCSTLASNQGEKAVVNASRMAKMGWKGCPLHRKTQWPLLDSASPLLLFIDSWQILITGTQCQGLCGLGGVSSPKSAFLRCVHCIHWRLTPASAMPQPWPQTDLLWEHWACIRNPRVRSKSCHPLVLSFKREQRDAQRQSTFHSPKEPTIKQAAILIQMLLMTFPPLLQKQLWQSCWNSTWTHEALSFPSQPAASVPCLATNQEQLLSQTWSFSKLPGSTTLTSCARRS